MPADPNCPGCVELKAKVKSLEEQIDRLIGRLVRVQNLTTAQAHGYKILGVDVLTRAGVVVDAVREPSPGERGFARPRKRPSRRLLA